MRELPIIMDGESVRAILAGRKTQTRRVMGVQPDSIHDGEPYWNVGGWRAWKHRPQNSNILRKGGESINPKYKVGDLLWVQESYMFWNWTEDGDPFIRYKADGAVRLCDACGGGDDFAQMERAERIGNIWAKLSERDNYVKHDYKARDNGWRSPLAMFKHFARLWLRVADVRAERLQDITEADAIAEGALHGVDASWDGNGAYAQGRYQLLWNMINAKRGYPWEDNPWAWVYEFEVERINR